MEILILTQKGNKVILITTWTTKDKKILSYRTSLQFEVIKQFENKWTILLR